MRRAGIGLLLGGLAAGIAFGLWAMTQVLLPFENLTWSWRVQAMAKPSPSVAKIRIVTLDQASLDWAKEENGLGWPWPRETYTYLLDFLNRAKPRVTAFDLIFSEPSVYGVADDSALAKGVRQAGNVILSHQGREEEVKLVPELMESAASLAYTGAPPDDDGIYRRLALRQSGHHPGLSFAAFILGGGQEGALAPLTKKQILRFRGPSGTFPTYPIADLIRSELLIRDGNAPLFSPETFRDCYVLFGFSAPGLLDLRASPIDGVMSGVEIHATTLSNLLDQDFMREVPWAGTLVVTLLFGLLGGAGTVIAKRPLASLGSFILLAPGPLAAGFAWYEGGYWLPVTAPTLAVVLASGFGLLRNYATEGRRRLYIKKVFQHYLHPSVIEELIKDPRRLTLGGQKKELSIFFSDLRGFTVISESLSPERLTRLLNDYLSAMTDIILAEGGTIDKYEGDAIIAFWSAPVDQPDHAIRAVRAAVACQETLAAERSRYRVEYGAELYMRIGINTGEVVVGNMGSSKRFDYTVLGDAVNLAARLEGINKFFGTETLFSEATARQIAGRLPLREVGTIRVVGKKTPTTVLTTRPQEGLDEGRFCYGLALFYDGDFSRAKAALAEIAPHDSLAGRYAELCDRFLTTPPSDWDGVLEMTEK